MKKHKIFLRFKEYLRRKEKEKWRNFLAINWCCKPDIIDWAILLAIMLVIPAILILCLGYKCNVWLNVPLTYLLTDAILIGPSIYDEIRWLQIQEEEYSSFKEENEYIMHLLDENKESEKALKEAEKKSKAIENQ